MKQAIRISTFLFVANLALFNASSVFAKDAELLAGNEVALINLKMDDFSRCCR